MKWKLQKETNEYKTWICLDDLIKVNCNYDLKNSIGKKIGFRCQFNNMPLQEKWFKIITTDGRYITLENDIKIERSKIFKNYNFIKLLNFSNLTEDIYEYIKNEEDKNRYIKSNEYLECICHHCRSYKKITYGHLKRYGFSCNGCSDGFSFPEKFMTQVLKQLNINFQTQLTKNTFDWTSRNRYDFYLQDYNIIIETHGEQHFNNSFGRNELENDMYKYDIAVLHGFEYNKNYFWIDCRKSNLEWMKENILNSKLSELFDLSKINWEKCLDYACSNLQHQVWEYWKIHVNENDELIGASDLKKIFPEISVDTICEYLKNGNDCGKCIYDCHDSKSRKQSLGYIIVDIADRKELYFKNTVIAEEELNINCGSITVNCQYNRDNDNLKLIHEQYLCFYKDDYTSLEDVLSRYKKQIQNELYQKQLISTRNDLLNVLKKIKNRKIKKEQQIISINEYGNIVKYDCANQVVNNLNTHVGAVYNPLNEQKESYINNTFYYFIKKIDFKSDYNYIEDLQNKRKELEQKQEEKVLKVIAIDNKYNKEYLRIEPSHDKYLKIKEKCDNTFNRKHNYCNNVIDNVFYIYQTDESLINKNIIEKDFKIYNKLNCDYRDTSVVVIDLQNNQKNIYNGINECAKQINGNRSSIGQICNETKCCTHRYKNGQYLIYFKTQWESISQNKQQEIIKLGKHID